tara:strand:- start:324 stop:974 length:651 start_codon:yes stop_codon:yes gene_type:complete
MIVSHRHKLIFTHIPKNAGTSIRAWLRQHVEDAQEIPGIHKHHTPHHFTDTVYGMDYTLFAVVRNPYDRLLSQYNFHVERYAGYLAPKSKLSRKELYHSKYTELKKGFANWITDPYPMADRQAKWYDYRWCPQALWCTPHTHTLRFETLEQDFRWVQDRVGVAEPLETLNSTSTDNDHRQSTNRVLLSDHRRLILSHLQVDFDRFGYAPDFDRSGQ